MMKRISTLLLLLISLSLYSQTGLIGSYPFNSNANDVSGFGNNGIVNGATLTNDRFGATNSAYLFDGLNDYIDLGQGYSYSSHSFAGWFSCNTYPVAPSYKAEIVSKLNLDTSPFMNSEIAVRDDKIVEMAMGTVGTWEGLTTTDTTVIGSWTFIVFSYDFTTNKVKLYWNGLLTDSSTVLGYTDDSTTSIYVGARPSIAGVTDFYFNGAIDDINIYNTAISQETIDSLYNYSPTTNINSSIENPKIIVSPNPTKTAFSLRGINEKEFQFVEIYDLTSRLILKSYTFTNIDLSNIENGIYIYKIYGGRTLSGKIVKE